MKQGRGNDGRCILEACQSQPSCELADRCGDGGKNIQVIVFEPADVLIMIFELCHVVCQIFLLTGLKLQLFVGLQRVVKHQKNQDVCCGEAENQDSVE